MRILSGRYNEQVNAVDIVNYENGYFLRLDCGKWGCEQPRGLNASWMHWHSMSHWNMQD